MSMTRTELVNAIREAAESEFANVPETDENGQPHVFSDRFERRMNKLIRSQGKRSRPTRRLGVSTKRFIAAAAAVLVVFCSLTFSVSAVREPVFRFVSNTYGSFSELLFRSSASEKIEKTTVGFSSIPDGFMEIETVETKTNTAVLYCDENGNTLVLDKTVVKSSFVDSQRGEGRTLMVGDTEVVLYASEGDMLAVWGDGINVFTLNYTGSSIDVDAFMSYVKLAM